MDPSGFVFQEKNIGRKIEVVLCLGIKESFRDIGRSQMSREKLEKDKDNEERAKEEDRNEEREQGQGLGREPFGEQRQRQKKFPFPIPCLGFGEFVVERPRNFCPDHSLSFRDLCQELAHFDPQPLKLEHV